MDELLEAVSEAVSAMVLYAVEADEKNTSVPDILMFNQKPKQILWLTTVRATPAHTTLRIKKPTKIINIYYITTTTEQLKGVKF